MIPSGNDCGRVLCMKRAMTARSCARSRGTRGVVNDALHGKHPRISEPMLWGACRMLERAEQAECKIATDCCSPQCHNHSERRLRGNKLRSPHTLSSLGAAVHQKIPSFPTKLSSILIPDGRDLITGTCWTSVDTAQSVTDFQKRTEWMFLWTSLLTTRFPTTERPI